MDALSPRCIHPQTLPPDPSRTPTLYIYALLHTLLYTAHIYTHTHLAEHAVAIRHRQRVPSVPPVVLKQEQDLLESCTQQATDLGGGELLLLRLLRLLLLGGHTCNVRACG